MAIAEAESQSPYYLLFGKQSNASGIYTKFWVYVSLPETGNFSCFTEEEWAFIPLRIQSSVDNKYEESGKLYTGYYQAELAGIIKLKKIVLDAINCCEVGFTNRDNEMCYSCPDNDEIKTIMKQYGFFEIPVQNLTVVPLTNEDGIFKQYAQVSAQIGGEHNPTDINADIYAYLNDIYSAAEGVYGSISHYDQLDDNYNCTQVMSIIYNENSSNYVAMAAPKPRRNAERKDDIKNRDNEENIFLKADVISLRDLDGKEFIYYRESQNLATGTGKSKIAICYTNSTQLQNRGEIAGYVMSFYNLIDIIPTIYNYDNGKLVLSDITDNDVVFVFANNDNKFVEFTKTNFESRYNDFKDEIDEFLDNLTIKEKGMTTGKKNLSWLVKQRLDNDIASRFGCSLPNGSLNKLYAFIIFHGTGHCGSFTHGDCDGDNVFGCQYYMDSGYQIERHLGNTALIPQGNPCPVCDFNKPENFNKPNIGLPCYTSIKNLIKGIINNKNMYEQIKNRY